jgi:cytochrome c-type biogenesis protein CcmH/NrfF
MPRRTRFDRWFPLLLPASIFANAVVMCLLLATPAWASYGEGSSRLQKLYASYIAPCCWRENLMAHHSPAADQLRSRISSMVDDGKSDDAIEQTLVAEFGKRILSLPEGTPRVWLFWTPIALLAMGAAGVVWQLRRMRQAAAQPAYEGCPVELAAGWDDDL